jgi:hypothetical protein
MTNFKKDPSSISNTLFHFTNKFDHVIDILTNNFEAHYSLEDFSFLHENPEEKVQIGIPMVSFCDLSLSRIKVHLKKYGSYGIGLTKKWGIEQGISPILYMYPKSNSTELFKRTYTAGFSLAYNSKNLVPLDIFANFSWYIKAYEGYLVNRDMHVRFYDEREWRYIPNAEKFSIFTEQEYNEKKASTIANPNSKSLLRLSEKLIFAPKDIKYIIVRKDSERLKMLNEVMRIKEKYSEDLRKDLSTKIISSDYILEDF